MKKNAGKAVIVFVLKMLYRCSSLESPITQAQMTHILNDIGQECDRRTVGRNIQYLMDAGFPIVKVPRKGFYYDKSKDSFFTFDENFGKSIRGRYMKTKIELVKYGVGATDYFCGPVCGPAVTEVQLNTNGKKKFYSLVEVDGMLIIFQTKKSVYNTLINMDADEKTMEEINKFMIYSTDDYEELYEQVDKPWFKVAKYLVYITRATDDEASEFVSKTLHRILEEVEIPKSDIEEDMEDQE